MQEKRSGIQKESANFWTDAPNTLVAILSGNIALLQAFEKERQMEEEDEEEIDDDEYDDDDYDDID